MRRWTTRPNTRPVDRERKPAPPQPPRGAKQIVIPMTRPQYDEIWHDPRRIRAFVDGWARSAPELFPAGFDRGYRLHGFGRESRKLPGLKLRKVVTGRRLLLLAPPQLRRRLHDRHRRRIGLPAAPGGAWRPRRGC